MAVYTTYATDVQYGPWAQAKLDVYKHPAGQVSTGNPCIIYMGGGGWNGTDKGTPGALTKRFDLFNYLPNVGVVAPGSLSVPVNWISVAYPSAGTASGQRASTSEFFPWPVIASQMAIQFVKENATAYGINPSFLYGFGDSAGSTNLGLAHFMSSAATLSTTSTPTSKWQRTFSSRLLAWINFRGQIDYRAVGASPTMDWTIGPQKLFGVTSNVELAALNPDVLASASVLAHVAANKAANRSNHVYSLYEDSGTHVIPYSAHDSAQLATLHNALDVAGVENVRTTPFVDLTWSPNNPSQEAKDAISAPIYTWMMARRTAAIAGLEPIPG